MSLAERKAAARKAAFLVRKDAFAAGQGQAAKHLAQVLADVCGVLAGYMPMRTEIDPLPAMSQYPGRVCVPVVMGAGLPLSFREWAPDRPMIDGVFGAQIPEQGVWLVPDVLIVPLLAWDRQGFRLGYGGGFYDRTLEELRATRPILAIGFAFAAQEVAQVPTDATDQPLDMVVTQAGALQF